MLGLGTHDPAAVTVLDELLDAGTGLELIEMDCKEAGKIAVPGGATLIAIIRDGERLAQSEVSPSAIEKGDQIVVLRDRTASEA